MSSIAPACPESIYGLHPSDALVRIFRETPWQGQNPERASILFVGRDANYSREITELGFFQRILDYHRDGVTFWRTHGVHHPFLLPSYPLGRVRGGVRYHATFQKMGLEPDFAPFISFVELLDVPTIGVTGQAGKGVFDSLLRREHLEYLERLMSGASGKTVFLSPSVVNDMCRIGRRYQLFEWAKQLRTLSPDAGRPAVVNGGVRIYLAYHFSDGRVHAQLPAMGDVIRRSCDTPS